MPRAGIVTFTGKPNAGKSSLLNRFVGQKLAITSRKPQSTRDRVVGLVSRDDIQLVILDTPGLLEPRYALQRAMRATVARALQDADVIAYVCDATEGPAESLAAAASLHTLPAAPVVTVYNKIDLVHPADRGTLLESTPDAVGVSALTGDGIPELEARLAAHLPESPFLYDAEDASTQSVRFFVTELVRETALEQLSDEVPYALACQVEEFREEQRPVYIRAVLYVERESQKRILIGAGGATIRSLGRAAREKIEALVGLPVYLDLWVKVLKNWRRDVHALKRFGYAVPEEDAS
jgi:GTP-binding protein Era